MVRAVREAGAAGEIIVAEASEEARGRVMTLKLADRVTADTAEAVRDADLIVFAVPVMAMEAAAKAAAPGLKPGATVTDVGSVKGHVAEVLTAACPEGVFVVPGHPIAGTEQSGPDAGSREDVAYREAVARLALLWTSIGARVEEMDARHHDLVLAITSHLPHLIAYNIVGTAADLEGVAEAEVMKYSAGGFRDFTRIAASDPTMWRDVFLTNKDAVLEVLGRFTEDLQALSRAIRWGEGDKLFDLFSRTREIRRGIVAMGQESAEPNFGRDRGKH
jgi:cyclohexadieny/prephenate dehydrogenase